MARTAPVRRRIRTTLWMVWLAAAPPALAQQAHTTDELVVTVGEGIVQAAPDRAFISAAAEARDRNPRNAQRRVSSIMSDLMEELEDARIPKDAIRTTAVELHPEFDYSDGKQSLRGYLARNAIEVRVDALASVGEIIDVVVKSGATSVGGVRFDLRNRTALEREAMRLAVVDARARAEAAAAGVGRSIGSIVRIEEQRHADPRPIPMLAARMEAAAPDTPVVPGDIEVRAHVILTARLR